MLWTKLLFILSVAVAASSTPLFAVEENIFEKIINVASSHHFAVRLYLEQFFESVGFKRGSADWKFVAELLEILRGRVSTESHGGEDPIYGMLYEGVKSNATIPPAVKNVSLSCKLCLGLIAGLRVAVRKTSYAFLEEQSIKICKMVTSFTHLRSNDLCKGSIKLMGPHVNHIVNQPIPMIPKICPYMNTCTSSEEAAQLRDSSDDSLEIKKSPKPKKELPALMDQKEERSVIKIVQLTDIHMEKRYKDGTATYCGLPVCCIEKWGRGESGHFGDYQCNVPERTVEGFLRKLKDFNADAVLFTGDVSPHTVWEETYDSQVGCTERAAKLFEDTLLGMDIFPIIGNHETYPTNLFSLELTETKNFLEVFKESWKNVAKFTTDDLKNIGKGGFYTKLVRPGLRVVAFNSAYMYTSNIYNVINHEKLLKPEAKETKNFVESSLKNAADRNEKVILVFHHPPGGSDFIISQSVWLERLMLTYSETIVLTTNGHTHNDEFRIVYDRSGNPASVLYVAPSVTTYGNINPSMRVFHLDSQTFQVLDYDQYYLDINELSGLRDASNYNITNFIKKSYSARDEYNLPDLSPSSWHDLTVRMEKDDGILLKYLNHFSSNAVKVDSFGSLTRRSNVCRLRNVHHDRVRPCTLKSGGFLP